MSSLRALTLSAPLLATLATATFASGCPATVGDECTTDDSGLETRVQFNCSIESGESFIKFAFPKIDETEI